MTEFILCVAAVCIVGWVVMLKVEIDHLQTENTRLRAELDRLIRRTTGDVEVTKTKRNPWDMIVPPARNKPPPPPARS